MLVTMPAERQNQMQLRVLANQSPLSLRAVFPFFRLLWLEHHRLLSSVILLSLVWNFWPSSSLMQAEGQSA